MNTYGKITNVIFSRTDFINLTDQQTPQNLIWEKSKAKALIDEGLLLTRDLGKQEEFITFTFELLGGYLIARNLFEYNKHLIIEFLNSSETTEKLFSDNKSRLHPLYEV